MLHSMLRGQSRRMRVPTNGIHLSVATQGDPGAPVVLLLHGWPGTSHNWRQQMQPIADAGFRAVAPDLRGFGYSACPQDVGSYGINAIAADLLGLLGALDPKGVRRCAAVVGHDWGATIAWHLALLHPDAFPAIVSLGIPPSFIGALGSDEAPVERMRASMGENFFYIVRGRPPLPLL